MPFPPFIHTYYQPTQNSTGQEQCLATSVTHPAQQRCYNYSQLNEVLRDVYGTNFSPQTQPPADDNGGKACVWNHGHIVSYQHQIKHMAGKISLRDVRYPHPHKTCEICFITILTMWSGSTENSMRLKLRLAKGIPQGTQGRHGVYLLEQAFPPD